MRILVIEDEPAVADHICRALTSAGFLPHVEGDGEQAWFIGDTEVFAAAILDLGLPQLDGISVLKRWRQSGRDFPVIVLTARGSWRDRVDGINAGADDYLGKPFHGDELIARVHAILRRVAGASNPEIVVGRIRLDPRSMTVNVDDAPVKLSPLEYRLVSALMHKRGTVVGFTELYEHVYGSGEPSSNTLETLVARVRRRLGTPLIETRRGAGYIVPIDPQ